MIRLEGLGDFPSVRHGFMTRQGGTSSGIYASLNCGPGSGDDSECVRRNRALALERAGLDADSLVTAYQIHGDEVKVVESVWPGDARPKIDAMVTAHPGISLGILTADCVPVLFADATAEIIGAAHAGWRGALKGVLENTLAAMQKLGARAENIVAGIGPAIQQASYEVGQEFPGPFLAEDAGNQRWFQRSPDGEHWQFDLPGYVAAKLRRAGIERIDRANVDTCADEQRFYSHRRMVRRGERDYGRQLSVIGLIS